MLKREQIYLPELNSVMFEDTVSCLLRVRPFIPLPGWEPTKVQAFTCVLDLADHMPAVEQLDCKRLFVSDTFHADQPCQEEYEMRMR